MIMFIFVLLSLYSPLNLDDYLLTIKKNDNEEHL